MEERGRAKAKGRPNRLVAETAVATSWTGELGASEGKRETSE